MTLNDVYDEQLYLLPNKLSGLSREQWQEILEGSGIHCYGRWIDTTQYSDETIYGCNVETGYYELNEKDFEKGCHDYVIELGGTVLRTRNGFTVNGLSYNKIKDIVEMVLKFPSAHRFRINAAIEKHEDIISKSRTKIETSTRVMNKLKELVK